VKEFIEKPKWPMTESIFYAVLCGIAIISERNIVVLPVEFMRNLREKEEEINEIQVISSSNMLRIN
jgi:hypothetical protein